MPGNKKNKCQTTCLSSSETSNNTDKLDFENSSDTSKCKIKKNKCNNSKNNKKPSKDSYTENSTSLIDCDSIKLLEIIESLNKEVRALKKKVKRLENKNHNSSSICDMTESYLNGVDKTVAAKLDELTKKVNERLKCVESLIISTRKNINK